MLIRFVIENMFSFGERKEFTTIPNKRLKTLQEHKYNIDGFEILKLSSIYGANGAWVVVPVDFRAHGKDERLPVKALDDNVVHWKLMLTELAGK